MPKRKPTKAELIAARAQKKRETVLKQYHLEARQLEEDEAHDYWIFLVVSLPFITIALPVARLTDETLAHYYLEKRRSAMVEAILDYQALTDPTERA